MNDLLKKLFGRDTTNANRSKRKRIAHQNTDYRALELRKLLATLTVDTLSDVIDLNDGLVSLREAITATNDNAAFGDAAAGDVDGDVIQFAPEVAGRTIELLSTGISITDDLQIKGSDVTLEGGRVEGIVFIQTSELVTLSKLNFTSDRFRRFNDPEPIATAQGGAIVVNGGNLTISQVNFESLESEEFGGAIASFDSQVRIGRSNFELNDSVIGGAIYSSGGRLNLFQTTFTTNVSDGGGAVAIDGGELFVSESTFSLNRSSVEEIGGGAVHFSDREATGIFQSTSFDGNKSAGSGAGLYIGSNTDAFFLSGTSITRNVAARESISTDFGGGGFYSSGNVRVVDAIIARNVSRLSRGGGVLAEGGELRIVDSVVFGNLARINGGGISAEDTTLAILSSNFVRNRVSEIDNSVALTDGSQLEGGGIFINASTDISPVIIRDSLIDRNFAEREGGGIFASAVDLRIQNSQISNNRISWAPRDTINNGGGGGLSFEGGQNPLQGSLTITDSVVHSNVVRLSDGVADSFFGGGILTEDVSVSISDSQIYSNISDGNGGGIAHLGDSTLRLTDTSIGVVGGGNRAGSESSNLGMRGGLGGGMYINSGASESPSFEMLGGTIRQNTALISGGGVYFVRSNDSITAEGSISDSEEKNLTRIFQNRALFGNGGGIAAIDASLKVNDAYFQNNRAKDGGAIFISPDVHEAETVLDLSSSFIRYNTADENGGGISLVETEFIDTDNVFAQNSATNGADVFSV